VAVAGIAGGLYSYADADRISSNSEGALTASEYRQGGVGLLLLGAAAFAVGLIDGVRASDSELDDGVMSGDVERDEHACRRRKTTESTVSLLLPNEHRIEGTLNKEGRVQFSLLAVPEAGMPTTDSVEVDIGDTRIRVALTFAQRASLRTALMTDPRSRLARDIADERRAACATAVASARAGTLPEPGDIDESIRSSWLAAKTVCGELWTPELETDFVVVDGRARTMRCNARLRDAMSTLDDGSAELEEVVAEVSSIGSSCSGAHDPQIRGLEARLATKVKVYERERAAEARRQAKEEVRAAQLQRRALQDQARKQRSWGNARLLCNDGTLSPTCTCGRSSYRGCCSWHGGVNSCSAD
jgi:hypothetical protein